MAARVVVVDDEALARAGCRLLLSADPEVEVVATVGGDEALSAVGRLRPDVVLLETGLSSLDGWDLLAEVASSDDAPAVAVLTSLVSDVHVGRALRSGASGFFDKHADPACLPALVRSVAAGGLVLSPSASRRVVDSCRRPRDEAASRRLAALTRREREVLTLLVTGASNAQIGTSLHLSQGTVKDHVSVILAKLGVASRLQAAVVAERSRLDEVTTVPT